MLSTALVRVLGPSGPGVVVAVLALGAAIALVLRTRRAPRASDLGEVTFVEERNVGRRTVRVETSSGWRGAPFVVGVLAPRIVFPAALYASLDADQREAVVAHELGHVAGLHAIVVTMAAVVTSVLWFVPFGRAVEREVVRGCELCADDAALRAGVDRDVLAATLVVVAERVVASRRAPALATIGSSRMLHERVGRLLAPPSSRPLAVAALRAGALFVVVATVLRATTFGNP